MANILVRAVPEPDAARIAALAARAGISQSEYLRRVIHEAAQHGTPSMLELAGSATGMFPADILTTLDEEWAT